MRESLEDTIRRVFADEAAKTKAAADEEKDPKTWLAAEIRRGVREVLGEILDEGKAKGGQPGGEDAPGFWNALVGKKADG